MRMSDQIRPVEMLTDATFEIGMLSSLDPIRRGLTRATRSRLTSIRTGNQKLPRVRRLAVNTYFSSDMGITFALPPERAAHRAAHERIEPIATAV